MNKIIIWFLLLLVSFSLTSCGKTNFVDLPKEKQEEITNYYVGKAAPLIGEMIKVAFDFNLSEGERDKKIDEFTNKAKDIFENDLKKQYPEVEFGTYEEFNNNTKKDNSIDEESKKIQKEYKKITLGEFHEFNNGENETIKVKVNDLVWKGTEYGDFIKYTAKNEFLFIRLEAENIGKKPTFKSLGDIKLITKDGYEFSYSNTEQNPDNLKEGYSGCIECELNPLGKAEQWVIFDINKIDLAGAKLRFEDDLVDFEL